MKAFFKILVIAAMVIPIQAFSQVSWGVSVQVGDGSYRGGYARHYNMQRAYYPRQMVAVDQGHWESRIVGYQTITTTMVVGYQPVVTGYIIRKGLSYGHWETGADGQRHQVDAYQDWQEPVWGQAPIYQTLQVPITQQVWVP